MFSIRELEGSVNTEDIYMAIFIMAIKQYALA